MPIGFCLFAYLAWTALHALDWNEVVSAVSRLSVKELVLATVISILTYGVASGYELLCRQYEQHHVSTATTLSLGFVTYTWATTLSSLLGNWAVRYRLYSRKGLPPKQITRITAFSISTNWAGFVLLAGATFLYAPPHLPLRWLTPPIYLRIGGAALLMMALAYPIACYWARGRHWFIRGVKLVAPPFYLAVMQLILSMIVWIGIASVIWIFLPDPLSFRSVLSALLLSTFAGMIIRVPAGVGVMEVIFVAMLRSSASGPSVIAALLAYRAVFQLMPLTLSGLTYLWLELPTAPKSSGPSFGDRR